MNSLYLYNNPGTEEIVQAVTLLRESNYKHNYYFAPYEATPQVFYLHDHYLGGSMCAFPDILMYAWYNFIIDIDVERGTFEWVKYSKETKMNERKNLAKMLLNIGYFTPKGTLPARVTVDQIREETTQCNSDEIYRLNESIFIDEKILEVLDNP